MKYFDKIYAWLNPIKIQMGETSYEASAIDCVFEHVKELEDKLELNETHPARYKQQIMVLEAKLEDKESVLQAVRDECKIAYEKLAEANKTIEALNNDDTEYWNVEVTKKLKTMETEKVILNKQLRASHDRIDVAVEALNEASGDLLQLASIGRVEGIRTDIRIALEKIKAKEII